MEHKIEMEHDLKEMETYKKIRAFRLIWYERNNPKKWYAYNWTRYVDGKDRIYQNISGMLGERYPGRMYYFDFQLAECPCSGCHSDGIKYNNHNGLGQCLDCGEVFASM